MGGSVLTNIFLVTSTSILEPNLKVFTISSNVIEKKKCFVKRAPTSLVIDNILIRYPSNGVLWTESQNENFKKLKLNP